MDMKNNVLAMTSFNIIVIEESAHAKKLVIEFLFELSLKTKELRNCNNEATWSM